MGYLLFMSIQFYMDIEWRIEVFQHCMLCIFLRKIGMLCRDFPIDAEGIIENRDTTISLRMIEVATFSSNSRSLKLSNLVSGIAYGALLPDSESIL